MLQPSSDSTEPGTSLELTPDQERFAVEYVATGGNATQAYLRIRPSVKLMTARSEGSRLMGDPRVSQRVAEIRAELTARSRADLEKRREMLESIAYADQLDIWEQGPGGKLILRNLDEIPPEARLAIQELAVVPTKEGVQRRVKLYSRTEAIEMLNRMEGVYTVKVQHEGEITHKHTMALPEKMPSRDEWLEQYGPKMVQATVESAEANER